MQMKQTVAGNRPDIAGGRLDPEAYRRNFADLHPPLDPHEALVEADRCYFCFDAPCTRACPTSIDIPLFIRQITPKSEEPTSELQSLMRISYAVFCLKKKRHKLLY